MFDVPKSSEALKPDWKDFERLYPSLEEPEGILAHYTSLKVFWEIIDQDILWAKHTRFSNDAKEIELGKEALSDAVRAEWRKIRNESIQDIYTHSANSYMICFCHKEDEEGDL